MSEEFAVLLMAMQRYEMLRFLEWSLLQTLMQIPLMLLDNQMSALAIEED